MARYEEKTDIVKNDTEFHNLVDRIVERQNNDELLRAINLLVKFGDVRYKKMEEEQNPHKKKSFKTIILPYYKRAFEIGGKLVDLKETKERIDKLQKE